MNTTPPPTNEESSEILAEIRKEETDERCGLPSASAMPRIMSCLASLPLTNYLRERGMLPPDVPSEDAEHGTEVHRICAQLALGQEPAGEPEDIAEARELYETAEQEVIKYLGKPLSDLKVVVEERFWHTNQKGERIASGRFDLIAIDRGTGNAVLIDYKTGHNDVDVPYDNWQMKLGAILMAIHLEVFEVKAVIVQTMRKPTLEIFTPSEIADFDEELVITLEFLDRSHYLDHGFNPTPENCKYCPCRLHCPRLLADRGELVAMAEAAPDADHVIACATTPRLSKFLTQCASVELLAKAAKAEMTARLERGETDENYHLEASAPKRVITDARAVVNGLIASGVAVDDALGTMKIGVGAAEELLKGATGLKGKALKDELAQLAGDALTMSEPTPKLARK